MDKLQTVAVMAAILKGAALGTEDKLGIAMNDSFYAYSARRLYEAVERHLDATAAVDNAPSKG